MDQPCIWFKRKTQASSPNSPDSLPCSIMEKPHGVLDECPRILFSCFRARHSGSGQSPSSFPLWLSQSEFSSTIQHDTTTSVSSFMHVSVTPSASCCVHKKKPRRRRNSTFALLCVRRLVFSREELGKLPGHGKARHGKEEEEGRSLRECGGPWQNVRGVSGQVNMQCNAGGMDGMDGGGAIMLFVDITSLMFGQGRYDDDEKTINTFPYVTCD